jgi:hypothetical protein
MMQHIRPSFFPALFIFIIGIAACSKICDDGYEGKRCDVEIREKYIGAWHATDNPGAVTFTDTISKGTGILEVAILRRFGTDTFNRAVKATISGNTITIANQSPDNGRELSIQGTGTLGNNDQTITWNYNLIAGPDTLPITTSFTGVWTK